MSWLLNKKFIGLFALNFFIVFFINIIAYFFSNQININLFVYTLAYCVIISFLLIIWELIFSTWKQLWNRDYNLFFFILLLSFFFYLKFKYYWEYYYFRYENYVQYKMYFLDTFSQTLNYLIWDFRNFNGVVIVNYFKDIVPSLANTQHYLYLFFNFIWAIYLYRLFKLFSKDRILPILLVFIFLWIEQIFITSVTITYVNIIISAFIIFLYYMFYLEKNKTTYGYIFYTLSYLFLITSRPDFFFLAIVIEFLNAYFKQKSIITFIKNIWFYIFLVPYYFIINKYLLFNIHKDVGLLWTTHTNENFWSIFINKFFSIEIFQKLQHNVYIVYKDLFFTFIFIITILLFIYLYKKNKIKNPFSYLFLFIYSVIFFLIVIFIHIEWFDHSIFKYFSIIYVTIYILFWLLILKLLTVIESEDAREKIYIWILLLLFLNIWNSLYSYNQFRDTIKNNWKITYDYWITMNARSYDALYNTNILFHESILEWNMKQNCKTVLVWNMSHEYNSLFPENPSLYLNKWKESYTNISNEKCINLYVFSERFSNKKYELNSEIYNSIHDNFIIERVYDRFIDSDVWLNLYIFNNKNVK